MFCLNIRVACLRCFTALLRCCNLALVLLQLLSELALVVVASLVLALHGMILQMQSQQLGDLAALCAFAGKLGDCGLGIVQGSSGDQSRV
jgi:hypothetical protein